MTIPLKSAVPYHPHKALPSPTLWGSSVFCFDEPKMNLLWLLDPTVDEYWDKAWEPTPIALAVMKGFSHDLRYHLAGYPVPFWEWWTSRGMNTNPNLVSNLPPDYILTMERRVRYANNRIHDNRCPVVPFPGQWVGSKYKEA